MWQGGKSWTEGFCVCVCVCVCVCFIHPSFLYPPPLPTVIQFYLINSQYNSFYTFPQIFFIEMSFVPPPPWWDAVLQKRLAWSLFVLLLSTLVCCQPAELIMGFIDFLRFTHSGSASSQRLAEAEHHAALLASEVERLKAKVGGYHIISIYHGM